MSTELNTKHSQLLNIIILKFFSPVLLNLQGNMFLYCPAVKAIQKINSSSINLPGFVIENVWQTLVPSQSLPFRGETVMGLGWEMRDASRQTLASPGCAKYLYGAVTPQR